MPFMGQDWRDPGECWIKTDLGWEPARLHDLWSTPASAPINIKTSYNSSNIALAPIAPSATPPPPSSLLSLSNFLMNSSAAELDEISSSSNQRNNELSTDINNVTSSSATTDNDEQPQQQSRRRSYADAVANATTTSSGARNVPFVPKRMFDVPPVVTVSTSSPANAPASSHIQHHHHPHNNQSLLHHQASNNKETPTFLREIENFNWRGNRNNNNSTTITNAKPPKPLVQQQQQAAAAAAVTSASSSSALSSSSSTRPRSTRMSLLIKRAEGFEVPDELLAGSSSDEDSSVSSNFSSSSYAAGNKENVALASYNGGSSLETSDEATGNDGEIFRNDINESFSAKKRTCSQSSIESMNNLLQTARKHQHHLKLVNKGNTLHENEPVAGTASMTEGSTPIPALYTTDENGAVVSSQSVYQPYCYVVVRTTRERAGYTSIADAFCRLDFTGAAKDIRRFHYVCKVLDLLIGQRLTKLGGQAQKYLFKTVEHVIEQVFSSEQNLDSLRQLLTQLDQAIHDSKYWGNHVGSSALWSRHRVALQQWSAKVQRLQLKGRTDDNRAMLHDLPAECLRLVLLFLTDHKDVLSASEADPRFARFAHERHLWYDLCWFHFKPYQLAAALKNEGRRLTESHDVNALQNDWKALYYKLKRMHGLRESYAETIILCTHCKCLFWQDWGHPCVLQNEQRRAERAVPLAPSAFVDLFAL